MILILDYGAGNIKSVVNAFDFVGADIVVSNDINDIKAASKIVIPGVGTYEHAMSNIKNLNLVKVLREKVIDYKTPTLGICLGMQILSTIGYEYTKTEGLNFIEGSVEKFDINFSVPHIGWNEVEFIKVHPVLNGISMNDHNFYFVHNYYFRAKNEDDILGMTDYGIKYASIIGKDNIIATQFHPEKSQENGLKLIENFMNWDFQC